MDLFDVEKQRHFSVLKRHYLLFLLLEYWELRQFSETIFMEMWITGAKDVGSICECNNFVTSREGGTME